MFRFCVLVGWGVKYIYDEVYSIVWGRVFVPYPIIVWEVLCMGEKLRKLLEDIEVLERDLGRVEHVGVKNVIQNMIARKQMAIAKIKALEDVRKRAYGR